MTARTRQQQERYEAAREARVEKAKERLRTLQRVVQCEVEGLSISATARRLCVSRLQVMWLRHALGLTGYGESKSVLTWKQRGFRE